MIPMLIGYARCSSDTQFLHVQVSQLRELGCHDDNIHTDQAVSGTVRERSGLAAAMSMCRAGDTLVVVRMDRLTRSTVHARDILDELWKRRVKVSLGGTVYEADDAVQVFTYTMLAAVAEMEHCVIHQRTQAGIDARKARGEYKGRPRKLDHATEAEVVKIARRGGHTQEQLASAFGVSRITIARIYQRAGLKVEKERSLCPCGKPITHLLAQEGSHDWHCNVVVGQKAQNVSQ